MEELLPILTTVLAAVIGALGKKWLETREKRKVSPRITIQSTSKPGTNGWTNFATLIVTNLQREIEVQRDAYKAKIVELETRISLFEASAKRHKEIIEDQKRYILALRSDAEDKGGVPGK